MNETKDIIYEKLKILSNNLVELGCYMNKVESDRQEINSKIFKIKEMSNELFRLSNDDIYR